MVLYVNRSRLLAIIIIIQHHFLTRPLASFVKHGSGKRSFVVIESIRHEIEKYQLNAYGWENELIRNEELKSYPEGESFQQWREKHWEKMSSNSSMTSKIDQNLPVAFTNSWNGVFV